MDEQMVPIVLGEAQKAVDIFNQTVDTLKKFDTIDAVDKRFAAELGPQDPLDQVEKAVDIATQVVELAKETKTFTAIDERLASEIRPKQNKIDAFRETMPNAADKIDENLGIVVDQVGGIIVECIGAAYEAIKKELKKDHGSKVKAGRFVDCPVVAVGTTSCIVVDEDNNTFVYLTPENVLRSTHVKKNFRLIRGKTYYFYELVFRDGSQSYIRVSKKHRNNLECCGRENIVSARSEGLPPDEECEDNDE